MFIIFFGIVRKRTRVATADHRREDNPGNQDGRLTPAQLKALMEDPASQH